MLHHRELPKVLVWLKRKGKVEAARAREGCDRKRFPSTPSSVPFSFSLSLTSPSRDAFFRSVTVLQASEITTFRNIITRPFGGVFFFFFFFFFL